MRAPSTPPDIAGQIKQLQQTRQSHEQAIAAIDRTLGQIGDLLAGVSPSAPPAKPVAAIVPVFPSRGRRRGRSGISGTQFILQIVGERGQLTTSQIDARWKAAGRTGKPHTALGQLVADKKLKREKEQEGRGSWYTLMGSTAAPEPVTKPTKAGKGKRVRGVFASTGEDSVLGFIKAKGNPTTGEINAHWLAEGRKGGAGDALGKLVKERKIRREPNKGGLGSRYRAV